MAGESKEMSDPIVRFGYFAGSAFEVGWLCEAWRQGSREGDGMNDTSSCKELRAAFSDWLDCTFLATATPARSWVQSMPRTTLLIILINNSSPEPSSHRL